MNPGQEQFLNYIIERSEGDKAEEIRSYLMESFKKQAEGTYTGEDAMKSIPVILGFLKPEHVAEVQGVRKLVASNPRASRSAQA